MYTYMLHTNIVIFNSKHIIDQLCNVYMSRRIFIFHIILMYQYKYKY